MDRVQIDDGPARVRLDCAEERGLAGAAGAGDEGDRAGGELAGPLAGGWRVRDGRVAGESGIPGRKVKTGQDIQGLG